jgi:glucose-6-phosphate isomerase
MTTEPISATAEWKALAEHADAVRGVQLRELFDADPGRAERLTFEAGELVVDFSKHLVADETVDLLVKLAQRARLEDRVAAMFAGEHINTTEDRAVLHVALRAADSEAIQVDGHDVVPDVHAALARMGAFSQRVRTGEWLGHSGMPIRTVVNIGIGGSDLGPQMACRALTPYVHPDLELRFVSNVDPAQLIDTLADLDPATTMFVVASKTFTTVETLSNARQARAWLLDAAGGDNDAVSKHFVAVSTNAAEVADFGIDTANMFEFWNWVGGRYSFDSAIGLTVMIAVGAEAFDDLLGGFREIDEHFRSTPLERNVPALAGLIGIWYRNFLDLPTYAVLPYCQHLDRFPAYLQQLDMESNGKSVRHGGEPVDYDTGPVVWGEPGTNGQHAFYQLLHQGTTIIPSDLIGFLEPSAGDRRQYDLLIANLIAQAEALAFGRTPDEVAAAGTDPELVPHRSFAGNRPTSVILAPKLTPSTLGQLVALYEHKVFTQGSVWDINSFDQWGVELGKALAIQIAGEFEADSPDAAVHDASTNALVHTYLTHRRAVLANGPQPANRSRLAD